MADKESMQAKYEKKISGLNDLLKEGEDKKIKALRHVMRPSISYTINPSFDQYYDTYEIVSADGLTIEEVEYSKFEGGIYGAPNSNYSNTVGFSLGNNIELKVRDKDSTATAPKKIMLLNNLIENQTLAELRDTLLPKLMSGEIRVKDAEHAVEAAV